jgi:DNA-binding NarL/FixJ family response regulator
MSARVLLVDDQALVRAGFRMILEREPDLDVVGEAADGVEALELAAREQPDVVLMDVRMPRLDGIGATRQLLHGHPHIKVIVLTTYDLDEYLVDALRAGASGFLLKDVQAEQLPGAVRAVLSGDVLVSSGPTRRLVEALVPRRAAPSARVASLTDREREVLQHIALGRSNREIAEALFVGETTVKTHVSRLLAKLGVRDRVGLVIAAYEEGGLGTSPSR